MSEDPLAGLPSRGRIAELLLRRRPHRNTFTGWQDYRTNRGLLVPTSLLAPSQWRLVPPDRKTDYELYRRLTNANLPLQKTPMLRGRQERKCSPTIFPSFV